MRFSPRTIGLLAAVVTVIIWTGFIVIARASAQRTLTPFDIALLRITGASLVLLPWGWWMVRRRKASQGAQAPASSLLGISPLPLRTTALLALALERGGIDIAFQHGRARGNDQAARIADTVRRGSAGRYN